jgi:hypothetical protein
MKGGKLDIPKRKKQLAGERQNLAALKATLQGVVDRFTVTKEREGILQTVGSPTWKALIRAARELNENGG